jgi:hypothetical protein
VLSLPRSSSPAAAAATTTAVATTTSSSWSRNNTTFLSLSSSPPSTATATAATTNTTTTTTTEDDGWRLPTALLASNHTAITTTMAGTIPIPLKQQLQQHSMVLESTSMIHPTPFKTAPLQPLLALQEVAVEDHLVEPPPPLAEHGDDEPPYDFYPQVRGTWSTIREWVSTCGLPLVVAAENDNHNVGHPWHRGGGGPEVEDRVEGNAAHRQTSLWDRTAVWFGLVFLLQIVLFPLWLNPILSTTVSLSKVCLFCYQRFLGVSNNKGTIPFVTTPDHEQHRRMQLLLRDKLLVVTNLQAQLQIGKSKQEELISMLNHQSVTVQENVARQAMTASQRTSKLNAVVDQLNLVVELDESLMQNPLVTVVAGLLERDSGSNSTLLDLSKLELWSERDSSEGGGNSVRQGDETAANDDGSSFPLLPLADVEVSLEELRAEFRGAVLAMQQDPATGSAVSSWIRDAIRQTQLTDAGTRSTTTTTGGSGVIKPNYLLQQRVLKTIATRFAVESADQTGQIDYASILNGATILSSSPSLVDNLPVVNRLASLWSTRFYGYGPEAALTPTHPPNALGQCWAFQKQQAGGGRSRATPFGVLTIHLVKSAYVESVLIENPPKELSDRVNTAIRKFRVHGFEKGDATGKAWPLGSFEYSLSSNDDSISLRQEFPVDNEVDGEEVPALRVIQLQIDSNWGAEYACLYRFRVHGEEGEVE